MLARILLVTAAASVAALGAAQPAAAKPKPRPQKVARFSATFEATYKTTWNEPKRLIGGSVCGGLNYQQGFGQETWTIKTRKPQKLIAFSKSYGALIHHGTWDDQAFDGDGIEAFGVHTRSGDSFWSTEPGTCGGEYERENVPADCGTRLPEYVLRFEGTDKYHPELSKAPHTRKEKTHFAACDIKLADELLDGAWPTVDAKLPRRKLFGKGRTVTIRGTGAWDNADEYTAKQWTTSSTLEWKLVLTRRKGDRDGRYI